LIGGFVLEFDNNLVDASVVRDLRDIKKQFQQNLYVPQMK
jgi:F-type H+-transporting ATPase subunit delta